jgi:hypothetical protein
MVPGCAPAVSAGRVGGVRTPADLLEAEAAALTELAQAERELGAAEAKRDALADKVAALRAEREGLQLPNSARTIMSNMAHAQRAEESRRRGRPTKSKHPFPAALDAAGSSVAEWARKHQVEREVVKSWFAPPPAGRRIPQAMAKLIEKEFKVPATERVWPNGIR